MPLGAGDAIALASVAVALLALMVGVNRDRRGGAMDSQTVRDKLDYISDTARDTREDVRALDRKMDDHANRITRAEARIEEQDRRISRLEERE